MFYATYAMRRHTHMIEIFNKNMQVYESYPVMKKASNKNYRFWIRDI